MPDEGQVLLRTLYLSLDPYMRNLMDEIGPTYAPSVPLGGAMPGGTVSRVVDSRHPLPPGDAAWVEAGKIRLREHRIDGLESAPAAFIGLLQGRNRGKVVVNVDGTI